MVCPADVDQSRRVPAELDREHLGDEDRVVAGLVLGGDAALEPREGARDQRLGQLGLVQLDALPERDRRHAAREVLRERSLVAGKEADREPAGVTQRRVRLRHVADRHADERGLERQRDERSDGQRVLEVVRVDGDHGDGSAGAPHRIPELLPRHRHGARC